MRFQGSFCAQLILFFGITSFWSDSYCCSRCGGRFISILLILLAAYRAPARLSALAEYQSWIFRIDTPAINRHNAAIMGSSVLRIIRSLSKRSYPIILPVFIQTTSTKSMVDRCKNRYKPEKISPWWPQVAIRAWLFFILIVRLFVLSLQIAGLSMALHMRASAV